MTPTTTTDPSAPASQAARRRNGASGHRLATAFEVVSDLPALAEAQRRLVRSCAAGMPSTAEMITAVEADAALAIAVMRAANNGDGPAGGRPGWGRRLRS